MQKLIFTVLDQKAESFGQPFFADTAGLAERIFTEAINERDSTFNKYPGDFTMFELGSYETQDATFKLHPAPLNRGNALTFIRKSPVPQVHEVELVSTDHAEGKEKTN